MRENRGYFFLVTGLILGVLLGMGIDRRMPDLPIVRLAPGALLPEYKDQYRVLIASAYLADGDLLRARERLKLLHDEDVYAALANQAQRSLSSGRDPQEAYVLGQLAVALEKDSSPGSLPTATAAPQAITPTAQALAPPQSSAAPTASGGVSATSVNALPSATFSDAPFVLQDRQWVCTPGSESPLIVVEVETASGEPVPGQEIVVSWDQGEERFFTGLKPEVGKGYADFEMDPGVVYSLRLEAGGQNISDLSVQDCTGASGQSYWGMWRLKFVQP